MNKDFIELLKKAQQGDERALEKCYTERGFVSSCFYGVNKSNSKLQCIL